ncbi:sigma factor [Isoptericola sp. F-RaC21]|uniref:sigma factor n=1 Tax=Isoptericola sp. F-RaC21 TaxID=3141452 RepID=UPI00315C1C7D
MDASTTEPDRTIRGACARPDDLERAGVFFASQRARLFRIALRVTGGDSSSAEDVVQEAWLRWQRTDRTEVRNPEAFLTTTTKRLAINVVQSASHRHEYPTDVHAPRPEDDGADPAVRVDQTAALSEALGLLLSRLSGGELAAYLLRKVFDYPYDEIARLLRTSAVNARQLVRRAAPRITRGPARAPVESAAHRNLVAAFLTASQEGEVRPLEQLLALRGGHAAARTAPVGAAGGRRRAAMAV